MRLTYLRAHPDPRNRFEDQSGERITSFPNYAGCSDVDVALASGFAETSKVNMKTSIIGGLHGWQFKCA
jgi:hypothetical protein